MSERPRPIDHLLDEAWERLGQDDYDGAAEALAQAREEEPGDAGVLELEAELALVDEDPAAALAAYEAWMAAEPDHPAPVIRAAETILDWGGDAAQAARLLRGLLHDGGLEPHEEADAHYLLGTALEERGDHKGMAREWLATLHLDEAVDPPRTALPREQFERIAAEALDALPQALLEHLQNVPVLVQDRPSREMVLGGTDPRLLGLFSGLAMPDQSVLGGPPATGTILLFQRNLERATQDLDELAEQIRVTVAHETAHYFGMDEDELRRIGLG